MMITEQNKSLAFEQFDHLPWGACVLDRDLVVHNWNSTLADWTHISKGEAIGANLGERYPHLRNAPYCNKLDQVFQTGVPAVFSAALHKRFIPIHMPDGMMVQKTVVRPLDRGVKFALVLIENTTSQFRQMEDLRRETKHLKNAMLEIVDAQQALSQVTEGLEIKNRELLEAKVRLEHASLCKSEFLANMSHELRTPMNAIMGFTQRLKRKLQNSLEAQDLDSLETIDRNADHLMRLINDVLDLSKIEAGKMELEYTEFDIVTAIEETVHQVASLTDGKPIKLTHQYSEKAVSVFADRMKVIQIITNLLSNAIKYTDEGEVMVSSCATSDPDLGPIAKICIQDTGIGIKEEDRIRLFSRFTQLDGSSTRQAGGTGLGLSIVEQYVHLHGGRIDVESVCGQGSTFTVSLPMKSASARLTMPLPSSNTSSLKYVSTPSNHGDH